jgi:hypothetical protein
MSCRAVKEVKEEEELAALREREVSLEAKIRQEVRCARRRTAAAAPPPPPSHVVPLPPLSCTRIHLRLSHPMLRHPQLVRSGERERLKRLLRERLTECGWRDEVKQRCRGAPGGGGGFGGEVVGARAVAKRAAPLWEAGGRRIASIMREWWSAACLAGPHNLSAWMRPAALVFCCG